MKTADLMFASANPNVFAFMLACLALLIGLAVLFSAGTRSRRRKLLHRTQTRRDFWGYE